MVVVLAGEVLGLRARGSPAKLRREVRLRSMGDSLAVLRGDAGGRVKCSETCVGQYGYCSAVSASGRSGSYCVQVSSGPSERW